MIFSAKITLKMYIIDCVVPLNVYVIVFRSYVIQVVKLFQ